MSDRQMLTTMYTRPSRGKKCDVCHKKTDTLTFMSAGDYLLRCPECARIMSERLIEECPSCYLSNAEYKEWKKHRGD